MVALFMQNQRDIETFCKQMVILDQKLPLTSYLSYGLWIVVTNVPLTFTINCQSHKQKIYDIKIESPFGIIKLNNTCKASNKYLQLPEYFGKHSYFERSDPLQALLKLHNITNFSIWNGSKTSSRVHIINDKRNYDNRNNEKLIYNKRTELTLFVSMNMTLKMC